MLNERDILTIQEVAHLFCCSVRTIDNRQRLDPLFPKPVKIGKRRLWRRVDLDSWFAKQVQS